MKLLKLAFVMLIAAGSFPLIAQTDATAQKAITPQKSPSIGKVLDDQLRQVESELVPAVEAMPEDKFDFAPTQGEFKTVRTFALQARHVATTNYWIYAALAGEKNPVDLGKDENGADTLKTKADIVKYLKDSYAFAHKSIASVPDDKWLAGVPSPFGRGTMTPLSIGVLLQGHQFDHYGQMVEYLRMNGIVPPASRPR